MSTVRRATIALAALSPILFLNAPIEPLTASANSEPALARYALAGTTVAAGSLRGLAEPGASGVLSNSVDGAPQDAGVLANPYSRPVGGPFSSSVESLPPSARPGSAPGSGRGSNLSSDQGPGESWQQTDGAVVTARGRRSGRGCAGRGVWRYEHEVAFDLRGGGATGYQKYYGSICELDEQGYATGGIVGSIRINFSLSGAYPGGLVGSFSNTVVSGTGSGALEGAPFSISVSGSWHGDVYARIGIIEGYNRFSVSGGPGTLVYPDSFDMDFYFGPPPDVANIAVRAHPPVVGVVGPGKYHSYIMATLTDPLGNGAVGAAPVFSLGSATAPAASLQRDAPTTNAYGQAGAIIEVEIDDVAKLPLEVDVVVTEGFGSVSGATTVRFEPASLEVRIDQPESGLETEADVVIVGGEITGVDPSLVTLSHYVASQGEHAVVGPFMVDAQGRFSLPVVLSTPLEWYEIGITAQHESGATHTDTVEVYYLGTWEVEWLDVEVPELVAPGQSYGIGVSLSYNFPLPEPLVVRLQVGETEVIHETPLLGAGAGDYSHTFGLRAPESAPAASALSDDADRLAEDLPQQAANNEFIVLVEPSADIANGSTNPGPTRQMNVGQAKSPYTLEVTPLLPYPVEPAYAEEGTSARLVQEMKDRRETRTDWFRYGAMSTTLRIVNTLDVDPQNPDVSDRLRFFIGKAWLQKTGGNPQYRYIGQEIELPKPNGSRTYTLPPWRPSVPFFNRPPPYPPAGEYQLCVEYEVERWYPTPGEWRSYHDDPMRQSCVTFTVDRQPTGSDKRTTLGSESRSSWSLSRLSSGRVPPVTEGVYTSSFTLEQGETKWFDTVLGASPSQVSQVAYAKAHRGSRAENVTGEPALSGTVTRAAPDSTTAGYLRSAPAGDESAASGTYKLYMPYVAKDNGPVLLTLDWTDPQADLDLHVIGPQGRIVGRDYARSAVRVNIPSAYYSGSDAKPEWLMLYDAPPGEYLINAYGVEASGAADVTISLERPDSQQAPPVATPSVSPSPTASSAATSTSDATEAPTQTPTATTPTATQGPTPTTTPDVKPSPTTTPGTCWNLVTNGDFEDGFEGWAFEGEVKLRFGVLHGGRYAALLLGRNGVQGTLSQTVRIPDDAISAHLTYWWHSTSDEPAGATKVYDRLSVLWDSAGNEPETLEVISNLSGRDEWLPSGYELIAAGGDCQIRIDAEANTRDPTSYLLDSVRLDVCAGPHGQTPQVSVAPQSGPPGTAFTISSSGLQPSEQVTAWLLDPQRLRRDIMTVQSSAEGTAVHTLATDPNWVTGGYAVGVMGWTGITPGRGSLSLSDAK